jgi:hypothetical protein
VVAAAMTNSRCKASEILPAIEQEFVVKDSAARKLLKEAIPEGDCAPAEAHGCRYSLSISCQGKSPPNPLFIVRSLVTEQAEAA